MLQTTQPQINMTLHKIVYVCDRVAMSRANDTTLVPKNLLYKRNKKQKQKTHEWNVIFKMWFFYHLLSAFVNTIMIFCV